jgi:superfamily I DNA and/or RNA helicase
MLKFIKTYKVYISLFALLWIGVAIMQYWVISPIREDNNRQKKEVKRLEKENAVITLKQKKTEALIVSKDKKIKELEALEQYYKNKASKTDLTYEKQKTDYVRRPVADRRRVFSKLANE